MILPLAFLVDWLVGDPDWLYQRRRWSLPHPVAVMGWLAAWLEKRFNAGRFRLIKGAIGWSILVLSTAIAGWLLQWALAQAPYGWLGLVVIASMFLAFNSLARHVAKVADGLDEGLEAGRLAVSHIVGRDPSQLDQHAVARASIESLAENFSDGVIAPLFWFAVAGLPGLMAYKAINTLDSMWGYRCERYERFGKAAARIDDAANWLPARLSGFLIVTACFISRTASAGHAWRAMRRDASKHNSPNAGWPEAAIAGGLGIRLAGPRWYKNHTVNAPFIGRKENRTNLLAHDIRRALRLYQLCGFVTLLACLAVGLFTGALSDNFFT